MNANSYLKTDYLPIPLIAAMVLTRFHHFGDVLHLPDASLAVFFCAGFFRKNSLLGFLLVLAGVIDYVAIANGTSAWCVTPAYLFLIPTYAAMWWGGRCCAKLAHSQNVGRSFYADALGLLTLATIVAFVISNGSFYLLSGNYTHLSLLQYADRVAQYFWPYVATTLAYVIAGYVLVKLLNAVATNGSQKTAL